MTRYIICVKCHRLLGITSSLNSRKTYYDYTIADRKFSNVRERFLLGMNTSQTFKWTGHYENCHPDIHKKSQMDNLEIPVLNSKYFMILDTMLNKLT